jgi:hypothetical protein
MMVLYRQRFPLRYEKPAQEMDKKLHKPVELGMPKQGGLLSCNFCFLRIISRHSYSSATIGEKTDEE